MISAQEQTSDLPIGHRHSLVRARRVATTQAAKSMAESGFAYAIEPCFHIVLVEQHAILKTSIRRTVKTFVIVLDMLEPITPM